MYFSRATRSIKKQGGAVFIVMLVILIMGAAAFLVSSLSSSAIQIKRDQVTTDALAQAKEALIGYAASADLHSNPAATSPRPGNLPCPDNNPPGPLEGTPSACGAGYSIGRLPWKTLGLPDLRDSSGERLWYAVSRSFKKALPYNCSSPGMPGCLNSDTVGTITVRNSDGSIIYDAGLNSGVVAVIIAPGDVLQRTDKTNPQDRSAAGYNNPQNYLDVALGEDNSNFTDGSSADGLIQGKIKDASGNLILNDQLLIITQDNIMRPVQKRVAAEVRQCLNEYALPANGGYGRYPWPAKLDPSNPVSYFDTSSWLFGRVPDNPFDRTVADSNDLMSDTWTGNCNINSSSGWWLNWKEMVFYGLADAYKPFDPPSTPASCGTCLSVNPPSAIANIRFVVIVAGKILSVQLRSSDSNKGTLSNYLEAPNNGGTTIFSQSTPSTTFNDAVVFQ